MKADTKSAGRRRIVWENVVTVLSVAILIGAEVVGAAYAVGWALATLAGCGGQERGRPVMLVWLATG